MVDAKHGITCPGTAADPRCSSSNHRCEYSPWNPKKIIKKNTSVAVCSWFILALYLRWIFQLPPTPPQKKNEHIFWKSVVFQYDSFPVEIQEKPSWQGWLLFWSGTSKKSHILNSAPPPLLGLQGFQSSPPRPSKHPCRHRATFTNGSPLDRRTWRIIPGLVVRISPPFKAAMKFGHLGSIGPTTPGITIGDDPPRSPRITSQAPRLVGVFFWWLRLAGDCWCFVSNFWK